MTGGEVLRGNASAQYELLARLAQGGMAEIFLARANGLAGFERYVVLKRIRPERDDDPRWVTMFLDEARLAAQLQHPNIAQVFDLGQIGDSFFYTMEFVHGEDVLDVLSRTSALGQRMPLHISLAVAAGACTGLAYAHDRHGVDGQPLHIVHRDISPANLMVSFDGVVKVLDFGVAKARNRDTKTEAGTIMGKVAYLSPEQCQTNEIDHRSDLFSLGIVLYEMVTHVRPFKRGTDYETLAAIVRFDPPPPSSVNPALPRGIDDLVMRALAKDPRNRWSSAHEMLEAIEAVADQAQASLAPRDLKRYMRDLYGTPPEPWRTIGGVEDVMGTFSGEVIGPLPTETRIKAFPADAMADDVPLLPLARSGVIGTPGAQHSHHAFEHDDLDDAAMTPHVSYRPVPARLPTDDLVDAAPTPIDMQPIRVHPTIERPPPIATPARATPPSTPVPRASARVSAQMPAVPHSQSGRLPVQPTPPGGMPSQPRSSSGPMPVPPHHRSGPLPAQHVSGPMPAPPHHGSGPLPAQHPSGPRSAQHPSGPMSAQLSSGPMPAHPSGPMPAVGASGPHNAPPGTIELIAPPSAIRALETAPIRVVRPEDAREGRRSRSIPIIVVTVLAVVGVGIGAMLALGDKSETREAPAASTSGPSITPIEEPTTTSGSTGSTTGTTGSTGSTTGAAGSTTGTTGTTTGTTGTTTGTTGTTTGTAGTTSGTTSGTTGTTGTTTGTTGTTGSTAGTKSTTGSTGSTGSTTTSGSTSSTTSATSATAGTTGTKSATGTKSTTGTTGATSTSGTSGAKSTSSTGATGTSGAKSTGTSGTSGTTGTKSTGTSGTSGTKSAGATGTSGTKSTGATGSKSTTGTGTKPKDKTKKPCSDPLECM